jgi:uncharacterized protein
MLTFLATVTTIWTLLHCYVGLRVLSGLDWSGPARAAAWVGVFLLAWAPFGAFFAGRSERGPAGPVLEWAGFTAMGLSSIVIVFSLVTDLLHVRSWGFEAGAVSAVILGGAVALTLVGSVHARRPRIVQVKVPLDQLPRDLVGFRIVQLSDLHIGHTLKRRFVEWVVRTANALDPDLIALTGDVADGTVERLRDQVAPLEELSAPQGKFFVTGNHEYYWGAPKWMAEMERLGFTVLTNSHMVVTHGAARVLVAGVPDTASRSFTGLASDPAAAVAGAAAADVHLLLAHQPRSAYQAAQAGFQVQLSGHTHGGQYFPFNLLVRFFQPFVWGLHRVDGMWLYVSRGTGYWGPPIRLGAPSEITVIELVPA